MSSSSAFHFVAITPLNADGAFNTLFDSLRRLSPAEVAAIRPKKVSVVMVRAGDSVASLAARMAYSDYKVERFRILNALSAGAVVKPGQKKGDQVAFIFVLTLLNVVEILPPSVVIAETAATAMSAAIRPYSMAVAPFELLTNLRMKDIVVSLVSDFNYPAVSRSPRNNTP